MSEFNLHNFFGAAIYAKALDSLARSLWIIFTGWMLLVPAVIMMLALGWADRQKFDFALETPLKMIWPWLAIVGGLLNLYGKYSCFELRQPLEFGQPLPGSRSLSIAFYADMAAALIRLIARGAWRVQLRWLAFPLYIAGQIMFLLFLRKIADVVGRQGLRRLLDFTLVTLVLTVICGGVTMGLIQNKVHPALFLGFSLVALIFLICTTLAYLLALAQLAFALGHFANYLRESSDDGPDEVEEPGEPEAV